MAGPAGLFIVDEITARALPAEFLIPAVDTDDLDYETGGIRKPTKLAVRTERDSCPQAPIAKHLHRNLGKMPQRGLRTDGRFWIPPRKSPGNLDTERLVIPRITRQLKAVVVPAGVLPINHNLSVCALPGGDLADLRDVITCERSQEWFRKTADRLEKGYFSVKTRTLRRLPV